MDLFEQISKDIVAAMKAKDKIRLETLRNIKKFFIEAKTAPGANDTLTDAQALKIKAAIRPNFIRNKADRTWLKKKRRRLRLSRSICQRRSRRKSLRLP